MATFCLCLVAVLRAMSFGTTSSRWVSHGRSTTARASSASKLSACQSHEHRLRRVHSGPAKSTLGRIDKAVVSVVGGALGLKTRVTMTAQQRQVA